MLKCEICGRKEKTEDDVLIFHRGCRLRAEFNKAGLEKDVHEKDGLLFFDLKNFKKKMKEKEAKKQ